MPFQYEQSVDSEDGNNVYLTIDETAQSICEKYMKQGIRITTFLTEAFALHGRNTGEIIAMVTVGGYDLNNPYELSRRTKRN